MDEEKCDSAPGVLGSLEGIVYSSVVGRGFLALLTLTWSCRFCVSIATSWRKASSFCRQKGESATARLKASARPLTLSHIPRPSDSRRDRLGTALGRLELVEEVIFFSVDHRNLLAISADDRGRRRDDCELEGCIVTVAHPQNGWSSMDESNALLVNLAGLEIPSLCKGCTELSRQYRAEFGTKR